MKNVNNYKWNGMVVALATLSSSQLNEWRRFFFLSFFFVLYDAILTIVNDV